MEKHTTWRSKLRKWSGFDDKSGFDWLELLSALLIPILLGAATLWFTWQQEQRQAETEAQQQAIADQRAQLDALQAYLDQIGSLLLNRDLRIKGKDSNVRMLARARTLTVLDTLGPPRKPRALEFLVEMKLIQADPPDQEPIISLRFADLHEVDMLNRDLLKSTDLDRANLNRAKLTDANLSYANLPGAHLFRAKLRGTTLTEANLRKAYLIRADLTGADLTGADLTDADLRNAKGVSCQQTERTQSLEGAIMPNGKKYEDWLKVKKNCGRG